MLILTSLVPGIVAAPESPSLQELRSGWKMASAKQISADGAKPVETAALRIEGYNVDSQTISVGQSDKRIGTRH